MEGLEEESACGYSCIEKLGKFISFYTENSYFLYILLIHIWVGFM